MQDFISQMRVANVSPPQAKTAPSVPGAATPKQPAKSHEIFEDIVNRRAETGEETPQSEPDSRLAAEAERASAEVAIEEAQILAESPDIGISQDGHERLGDPATRASGAGEELPQEASHIAEDDPQDADGLQPSPAPMQTDDTTAAMTRVLEIEKVAAGQSPSDRLSRAAGTPSEAAIVTQAVRGIRDPAQDGKAASPPLAAGSGFGPAPAVPATTGTHLDLPEQSGGEGRGREDPTGDRAQLSRPEAAPRASPIAPATAFGPGEASEAARRAAGDASLLPGDGGERLLSGLTDLRSISDPLRFGPVSSPLSSAAAQAADIGQQLVARLARAGPDGPRIPGQVDLTLNPAELGRVRLSMAPGEAGLVVSIQADRPETLDLMRRHSEQLMQEFRQAGFERAELSFGGTGSGQARDQMPDQAELLEPDLSEEEGPVAVPAAAQELLLSDGLNLRL
ncbi:MAG: hypothetical protein CMN19_02200 [Roseovarius sp.]|nr:hypothetical protein [Roseovarius sp.]